MKKQIILTVICLFTCLLVRAQSALSGINYQAIARDANGYALSNHPIGLKITLRAGDAQGKPVYEETHHAITNELGLFNIVVGKGQVENGEFTKVPWSESQTWMELAMDEKGGNAYTPIISTQLMAVPYAFYAGTAGGISLPSIDQDVEKRPCSSTGIPFWTNLGNNNVNEECHFLGTTNSVSLILKTDDIERLRIHPNGQVTIQQDTRVQEDLTVGGALIVEGGLIIADNLIVTPDSVVVKHQFVAKEDATIEGNLQVFGHGSMKTLTILGSDPSERFNSTTGEQITAGTVVVFDESQYGRIRPSVKTYDRKRAGVISDLSETGKYRPGIIHEQEDTKNGSPVAYAGTVEVRAIGPIAVGDYLTSSAVPGHAMAAKNRRKSYGAIIGKAITPLAKGEQGKVDMWVERH